MHEFPLLCAEWDIPLHRRLQPQELLEGKSCMHYTMLPRKRGGRGILYFSVSSQMRGVQL